MKNITVHLCFVILLLLLLNTFHTNAQQVTILDDNINTNGQVELKVNSTTKNYFITKIRHHIDSMFLQPTSITIGQENTTIITEPAQHYPVDNYKVLKYNIDNPFDTDNDGVDDIIELNNAPIQSPLNAASQINIEDGLVMIDGFETFQNLSIQKDFVEWSEFLNGKAYVKFIITNIGKATVYFINSKKHNLHADFADAINIASAGDLIKKGQVIYHPHSISNNGSLGAFAFNYSNGRPQNFEVVQATYEVLAANMPFLKNNLSYLITTNNEAQYVEEELLFNQSRVSTLFEKDLYEGIDYLGLHQAEGFGFLRVVNLGEIPNPRDIVLYKTLPNSLPRVAGIMTSAIQTPLSHVNIRAIQNNIPNAYIKNAATLPAIENLLNNYVYYKVEKNKYVIRAATLAEVNNWFKNIRPTEQQQPPLNLTHTKILPLTEIDFLMYDGYGAKCSNMASMLTFGFPTETIPNGFGIPFYFYQEFMKHNNFFEEIGETIAAEKFKTDRLIRGEQLKDLRKKIKNATMPSWMLADLAAMHAEFPVGSSVRCRSSSNNEDILGFNGAGLYNSKTQHPDEGHISKSIKQVYASLWNLRAFEEREFYRINHFDAAMGVLCHPNFVNEKANGVGISTDPFYNTTNTFYLNSQVGENLITNPETNAIPEEILLDDNFSSVADFSVIQYSNLTLPETTVLNQQHLKQLRNYLHVIDTEFKRLYHAENDENFAMDIEYKITSNNKLAIKQARPWVYFGLWEVNNNNIEKKFDLKVAPNPAREKINIKCQACNINKVTITNINGQHIVAHYFNETVDPNFDLYIANLPPGIYLLNSFKDKNKHYQTVKFIKH